MTRLLDDLTDLSHAHSRRSPDETVPVPIGMLRALSIMLTRYEGWPMQDRLARPEWLGALANQKLPGAKDEMLAAAMMGRRR